MLRMLIVDDEPIIADGLLTAFEEQQDCPFELCKAYCGREAIQEMMKGKVDILLTDICMPDMNGLELQAVFQRQWPHGKVVFLTGFDEFNYIQKAIRAGSVDYVLKTEGDEAIRHAVDVAVKQIHEDAHVMEREVLAEEARLSYTSLLRGRLVLDIRQASPEKREEIARKLANMATPLDACQPVMVMLGKPGLSMEESVSFQRLQGIMALQEAGRRLLSAAGTIVPLTVGEDAVLWLTQPFPRESSYREEEWDRLRLFLAGSMEPLQRMGESICGQSLMLAVMEEPVAWAEIGLCWEKLSDSLRKGGPSHEGAMVVVPHLACQPSSNAATGDGPEFGLQRDHFLRRMPILQSLLERRLFDALSLELVSIAEFLDGYASSERVEAKELGLSLTLLFLTYIKELDLQNIDDLRSSIAQIGTVMAGSGKAFHADLFQHILLRLSDDSRSRELHDTTRMMQRIRSHVQNHLSEDLSLTKMAGLLHFNPSYFSRWFKGITDMGYADYVAEARVTRVCELLDACQLPVNRIGEVIGHQDPSNFSRFFRKHTGMTPQEYRSREVNGTSSSKPGVSGTPVDCAGSDK